MNYKTIKRILDILLSIIGLPFVGIAMLIFGPLIWLEDKGSIFYNAPRRGYKGKVFNMYKFRSMKMNAPLLRNPDGSTYTGSDDPRVTKIGRFLRKTSVDELPQIINVLKGDMSFVGPRPTMAVGNFDDFTPEEKKHFDVLPGITGYTQAYYRNSISQAEKFRLDAEYVDNVSFGLDVRILFKTVGSVLGAKNINAKGAGREDAAVRPQEAKKDTAIEKG